MTERKSSGSYTVRLGGSDISVFRLLRTAVGAFVVLWTAVQGSDDPVIHYVVGGLLVDPTLVKDAKGLVPWLNK